MLMLKYIVVLAVVLCVGCGDHTKKYTLTKQKDIALKFETAIRNVSNISFFIDKDKEYITYVNGENLTVNFRNLNTDSVEMKISLDKLDSIQSIENGIACFVQNKDSIFVLLSEKNTIYLVNGSGEIKKHWDITQELQNGNKDYVLQDVASMKLFFKNNKIYVQVLRNDIVVNTPENKKVYFNSPSEVIIDITDSPAKISNNTGQWPSIYKTGLGYQDYWPARCINNDGEIIYSFGINDSLFIYKNDKLSSVVDAKTQYHQNINPYPADSNAHFTFLKKYNSTETRYKFLFYNSYLNGYYRVFTKGEEIETADGLKVRPWSFISLNPDKKVVNEMTFNSNEYNFFSILPTPAGVLICRSSEPDDEKNILRYGLFNLVQNEN
jgi:hypothetical protein